MSRLTIDLTEQQHQALKAIAALEGKTIKQYTLERLFSAQQPDHDAFNEVRTLLAERVAQAQRGEVVQASITEIAAQAFNTASRQQA